MFWVLAVVETGGRRAIWQTPLLWPSVCSSYPTGLDRQVLYVMSHNPTAFWCCMSFYCWDVLNLSSKTRVLLHVINACYPGGVWERWAQFRNWCVMNWNCPGGVTCWAKPPQVRGYNPLLSLTKKGGKGGGYGVKNLSPGPQRPKQLSRRRLSWLSSLFTIFVDFGGLFGPPKPKKN